MTVHAVVFGYHDVGVRCLKALLSAGLDVRLVVTHTDNPAERRWFASMAQTAAQYALPCLLAEQYDAQSLERAVEQCSPDLIFSFYYRALLEPSLLRHAALGAFNMHGSLLPKYRGRAPVNWAILRGERETGATLHHMVARADAGNIVDRQSVPILLDDTAAEVMAKVTVAAEIVLLRSLPAIVAGTAHGEPQRLEDGEYFGRRGPEDGRIDWRHPARQIHDLVRAVAPPYPGAFTDVFGERLWIHRTRLATTTSRGVSTAGRLFGHEGRCYVSCADGGTLEILAAANAAGTLEPGALVQKLSASPNTPG